MRNACKALIIKDGEYLLLRRANDPPKFNDLWDFPGGRQDGNENLEQTLIREVKEETELKVIPNKIERDFQYKDNEYSLHFYIFSIKSYSGEIQLNEEHTEYGWFSKNKLPKYLHPSVKTFFE
jgi:8-oxo-dGTP diphosphatase